MAMEAAIAEIDGQPGCHPHEKPYPRQARQTGHQIATEDDTKYRHQGNPGGAEWAVDFRLDRPENPDAQTHQYEGEQSADIGQLGNFLDRKQGSGQTDADSGQDSRDIGGPKPRMNPAKGRW